jgi:serine/threonine-protein kinase
MDTNPFPSGLDPVDQLAEEYLSRRRRGERPTPAEYAARFPEHAARILELFPALELMERLKPTPEDGAGAPAATSAGGERTGGATGNRLHRLGDYTILRELGRGGMGVVYEAVQESLGRHVALKVFAPWTRAEPKLIERFQREARAAARLHHTNIVPVFGVGERGAYRYYAMQFIQGLGLDAILQELRHSRSAPQPEGAGAVPPDPTRSAPLAATVARSLLTGRFANPARKTGCDGTAAGSLAAGLEPAEAARAPAPAGPSSDASLWASQPGAAYARTIARVGLQVAEALAHAHAQGVLHRDIKPSNLLLDVNGNVWVTDFGLAKSDDAEALTEAGDIVGTVRYMAPERFRGEGDGRADVYALGLTLYELLTLRPAFDSPDRPHLIERIKSEDPPRPRALDSRIPRDLETIVLKAIYKDPQGRYASAAALAEDLRRFEAGEPVRARPVGWHERLWRWCRREPALAGLTLTLIAGFLGVATQWFRAEAHLKEAVHQRGRAESSLTDALEQRNRAKENARREVAARRRAQERFDAAMTALRNFETITTDAALLRDPRRGELRASLLQAALHFYQELQASLEEDASPAARSQLSEAYARVAQVTWELGRQEEALATHRRSLALVEEMAVAAPADAEIRFALARCHTRIGFTLRTMARPAEARRACEQAREIQESLARDHPETARYREVLSWTLSNLGVIDLELGRPAEAIGLHRQAIAIHEDLVGRHPDHAVYRNDLGYCWRHLSQALAASGDRDAALRMAVQAVALYEELVRADRGAVELRWRLARCLDEVGRLYTLSGRPAEAAQPLERAVELHEALALDDPVFYGVDVIRNRLYAAYQRILSGRPEEAAACLRRVQDVLKWTPQVRPAMLLHDLACSHILWSAAGREGAIGPAEREARTRRAIAVLRRAVMAGYADLVQVRRDPVLDPLRLRRDFEEMILDLSFPADPFRS